MLACPPAELLTVTLCQLAARSTGTAPCRNSSMQEIDIAGTALCRRYCRNSPMQEQLQEPAGAHCPAQGSAQGPPHSEPPPAHTPSSSTSPQSWFAVQEAGAVLRAEILWLRENRGQAAAGKALSLSAGLSEPGAGSSSHSSSLMMLWLNQSPPAADQGTGRASTP